MVVYTSFRPLFLRLVVGLLLLFLLANTLVILLGANTPAQIFTFTQAESVGFEKQYKLHLMDIRTGLSPKISDQTLACCPIWSPDKHYIAFAGGAGETFIWDWRDGSTRSLGRMNLNRGIADWSPDSRSIIEIVTGFNGQTRTYDINRVDVDTSEQTMLVSMNKATIYNADWSSDGKFIVFMARIDYQEFIYRMDADGQNLQQLAVPVETILAPKISPDSQRILYVSAQNGVPGIYVMNADGSDQHKLIGVEIIGDAVVSPAWSPDSRHILYQSVQHNTGDVPRIHLMRVALDGTVPQVLTTHTAITGMPFCWLPDGSTVLYEAEEATSAEITLFDERTLNTRSVLHVNLPVYLNLAC